MDNVTAQVVASRYLLREVLGEGGMGIVYRAEDLERGTQVALKVLHPQHAAAAIARRAVIEGLAGEGLAGAVQHPNVVSVSDAGTAADGMRFLVMELVRGVSLEDLVHLEGPLPLRRATAIVGQILAGLQALHEAGFVHGDVKSGNVLVDATGGGDLVKLIDLGLTRTPKAPDPSGERMASGTPEYMAPEVVRGDGAVPSSDIYAAGVVLYQLLTGTTPFEGGTSREILRRQIEDMVVPPSLRCPDRTIPFGLEHAVMIALDKDPARRYQTVAAFAAAIAAATPSVEPARSPRQPRQVFSTDAPTLEWDPQDLPLAPRLASGTRPPPTRGTRPSITDVSGGAHGLRSRPPHRGTLRPCKRSTATPGPWALSTRRPR